VSWFIADETVSCATQAWRYRGQLQATVVVKATFALNPGGQVQLISPAPVVQADRTFGDHLVGSVQHALETAPSLAKCDVILHGHAWGRGKRSSTVRLALHRERAVLMSKTVHVCGDRDAMGKPRPFECMPLVYERAWGGLGFGDNPVGTDKPNLLDPADVQKSACFAPISHTWPARKQLLGSLDPATFSALFGGVAGKIIEVPEALPWAYFQAAPPEQQTNYLRGDECLVLDGVHPSRPRIITQLMGMVGAASVRSCGTQTPMELVADMLVIDGDRQVCSIVWRGQHVLPNEQALSSMVVLAGLHQPGLPINWEMIAAQGKLTESSASPPSPLSNFAASPLRGEGEPESMRLFSQSPRSVT
jgi:hypothetical protein